LFAGFNNVGIVPAGSFPNASFVGAKTVKSPFPLSVGAKPAAFTAVKRVDRAGVAAAVPAIVFNEDELLPLDDIPLYPHPPGDLPHLHPPGAAVAMAVKERMMKARAFMMILWIFEWFLSYLLELLF